MHKKKIILLGVLLLITAAAVAVYEFSKGRESMFVGTIEVTKVYISPRVASQVKQRLVEEGMLVKEGDVLYKLACEDIGVQKEKLTNDYDRAQKMIGGGTMSNQDYDRVKADYSNNALAWDWCEVKAPLTATVLTKYSEAGEWVSPGVNMMVLGDLTDVWAYVYVDQPMLASLKLNQVVTGALPELNGKKIKGKIIKVNDEAEFTPKNAQTRKERTRLVFGIKIKFDNAENILKPGMPIEVFF